MGEMSQGMVCLQRCGVGRRCSSYQGLSERHSSCTPLGKDGLHNSQGGSHHDDCQHVAKITHGGGYLRNGVSGYEEAQ